MRKLWMGVLAFGLATAAVAGAQAPAGAPAGANGICKDGTYSTAASKDGACRGHKGVQTWYAPVSGKTASTPAMPAPTTGAGTTSMPAPTPAAATPQAMPTPTSGTTGAAAPGTTASKKGPAASAASKAQAPGGGPGLVWVNTASNVYHCNGTTYYGKTKEGAYMTEDQAKAKGAHGVRGEGCAGK